MSTKQNKISKSKIDVISDEKFESVVKNSHCLSEVVVRLGFSATSGSMVRKVKDRIKKQKLDISHFNPFNHNNACLYEISELLTKNSFYSNRTRLKKRLLQVGLLKYECAICGNKGEWNNKHLSLQLHHINGISNDNRLENIQLLCPNCHSQTESYGGKNNKQPKE